MEGGVKEEERRGGRKVVSLPLPSTYGTRPEGDSLGGGELREEEEATHSPVGLHWCAGSRGPGCRTLRPAGPGSQTLDGLWKGTASRNGKDGMEESIHIQLEGGGRGEEGEETTSIIVCVLGRGRRGWYNGIGE